MRVEGDLIVAGDILPDVNNTRNVGSASLEFKDLRIDGVAHIDSLSDAVYRRMIAYPEALISASDITVTADRQYYMPLLVPFTLTIDAVYASVGTKTDADKCYAAVYADNTDTPAGGARLGTSADHSITGSWRGEPIPLTADLELTPALYWLAIICNNATPFGQTSPANWNRTGHLPRLCYTDIGSYAAPADPCPALTDYSSVPFLFARVKSIP